MTVPFLTVIVPVFNEERSVALLLNRVLQSPYMPPDLQVIVVDDGSRDGTAQVLAAFDGTPGITLLSHPVNRGKGAAVRTGLAEAKGEIVLIQDADLEYNPQDYPVVVEPIRQGTADAVYGSRYLAPTTRLRWSKFRVAVLLLNLIVRVLYGQRLTDEATCYKAVRATILRELRLESERFELCAEMTAKLCRAGVRIVEVPISYQPRSVAEGKKIGWRDAWTTFATLAKWRFTNVDRLKAEDKKRNLIVSP